MTNPFELRLRRQLNQYFVDNNIAAYAYRLRQARWSKQTFDIFVDSAFPKYYLALECKMVKPTSMYFSSHMKVSQVEEETQYLTKTGRTGILCIKHGPKIFMVPWSQVLYYLGHGKRLQICDLWRWAAIPSKGLWFRSLAPAPYVEKYECFFRYKPYDLSGLSAGTGRSRLSDSTGTTVPY